MLGVTRNITPGLPCTRYYIKAGRDDFQQHFACMRNKRTPSVDAISAVLLFVKDLMIVYLHCWGTFPAIQTSRRMW